MRYDLSPYLGTQATASLRNSIFLRLGSSEIDRIDGISPKVKEPLSYSAGMRIKWQVDRKSTVYAELGTSLGNDFISEDFFSVSIIPRFCFSRCAKAI